MDLTKTLDTVNQQGMWKIMKKWDCPGRFTHMIRQFHNGVVACVTDNRLIFEAFAMTNGVKQNCLLAPTLFSLMFPAMLRDVYRDERPMVCIVYRNDGHLLDSRQMPAPTRLCTTTIKDQLFAGGSTIHHVTEPTVQVIHTPDQDATDFTKCLEIVSRAVNSMNTSDPVQKIDYIVALYGSGGRTDHELGILKTLFIARDLTELPVLLVTESSISWLLLKAVNTSSITTFGTCFLSLDTGPRRLFPWVFVVADIPCDILGADLLAAFDLLVDCR
nr:unnamed protein product [Spirometra erinaceieuropaei]